MRTWQLEVCVVAVVLFTVAVLTGNNLADWIAAIAVLLTFQHAQIADRLAEREAVRDHPTVECHYKLRRYFIMKELFWCAVFVLNKTWPALVGVGVFLAYPMWRKWWRTRHPMTTRGAGEVTR